MPATLRTLAPLPLEADGSAKVYTAADITPITSPAMWRYTKGTAPDGETDYKKLAIKITAGGMTTLSGTMTYNDLAKLPPNDLASSPVAQELLELGAFRADVTGAGPAVYGLFQHRAAAEAAKSRMGSRGRAWLTVPTWYF